MNVHYYHSISAMTGHMSKPHRGRKCLYEASAETGVQVVPGSFYQCWHWAPSDSTGDFT